MPTKVRLVKAMVLPVVMYVCENWTLKKAECQRTDVFELWCWIRHLRVTRTTRNSDKSILKEISPEHSLKGLILKLKLQYFGHLMWSLLIRKDPDDGKDWKQEEKGMRENEMVGWHHRLNGQEFQQSLGVCEEQRSLAIKSQTWLSSWTNYCRLEWSLGKFKIRHI